MRLCFSRREYTKKIVASQGGFWPGKYMAQKVYLSVGLRKLNPSFADLLPNFSEFAHYFFPRTE
jgi:hypothetical protein